MTWSPSVVFPESSAAGAFALRFQNGPGLVGSDASAGEPGSCFGAGGAIFSSTDVAVSDMVVGKDEQAKGQDLRRAF